MRPLKRLPTATDTPADIIAVATGVAIMAMATAIALITVMATGGHITAMGTGAMVMDGVGVTEVLAATTSPPQSRVLLG
jgi:hypothetical protein